MLETWSQIDEALTELHQTRTSFCERSGEQVFVEDDPGLREAVYWYPPRAHPLRTPVESLIDLLQAIDAKLRAGGQDGEVEWLDALCIESTRLPLCRIAELTLRHFCPEDQLLGWVGLDKTVSTLLSRCGRWADSSPVATDGVSAHDDTLAFPLDLNEKQWKYLEVVAANEPITADGAVLKVTQTRRSNGHGKSTLASLKKLGLLSNEKGQSPRGYRLTDLGRKQVEAKRTGDATVRTASDSVRTESQPPSPHSPD